MNAYDDNGVKLMRVIAKHCRISYTRVAREIGHNYLSVKVKIERAIARGLMDVKPLVSAKLYGKIGALLRFKASNPGKIIEFLSKCNRVLGVMSIGDEIVAMLVARDKLEVMAIINRLSLFGDGLKEYSIEYGEIPPYMMIPVKNHDTCEHDCLNRIFENRSCLPSLSIKNNNRRKK